MNMDNNNCTNGFALLSDDELQVFANHTNVNIAGIAKAELASREAIKAELELQTKFMNSIDKIADKLPIPPANVYNCFLAYLDVDIEDKTQQQQSISIVKTQATLDANGIIITPAIMETVLRYPTIKVKKWIVTLNHVCSGSSKSNVANGNRSKLSIKLYKHNADSQDTYLGVFDNGAEACKHLKIETGKDSAIRVLAREGYYTIAC